MSLSSRPSFVIANTDEEVLLHRRYRAMWFHEAGYLTDSQLEALDDDGYDEDARHVLAFMDGEVIGASRITLPRSSLPWYAERFCERLALRHHREVIGEIARHGVAARVRRDMELSNVVHLGLVTALHEIALEEGLSFLLTGVHHRFFLRLKRLLRTANIDCQEVDCEFRREVVTGYEDYRSSNDDPIRVIGFEVCPSHGSVLRKLTR